MVKIGLQIKATLSNIDSFYPEDEETFAWPLKVKCSGCGTEKDGWHPISRDEKVEVVKAEVNFLYKCKICVRENHLTILDETQITAKKGKKDPNVVCKAYTSDDDGEFRTMVVFDCRGLELTAYEPRDGWAAKSGNKIFTNVDLSDKDGWTEFNDVDSIPVEISEVEYQFVTVK